MNEVSRLFPVSGEVNQDARVKREVCGVGGEGDEETMSEIPRNPMHRLAKKSGIERVSPKAAEELGRILEEIGLEICKEAKNYMMYSARKTLQAADVKAAARRKFGRNRQ